MQELQTRVVENHAAVIAEKASYFQTLGFEVLRRKSL